MKIGRTVPPAAAPVEWQDLAHAVAGCVTARRAIRTLEQDIRREFGVQHVFTLSSGTAALALTLSALRTFSDRNEVLLPAYTCFSVPAAVLAAGLRPVPCDINADDFDFDYALLAEAVGENTLCVISHHLFGIPSNVERTAALCRERGIFVVEDAAQAMGAEANGRRLGTLGDVGIFSLGRGKHITCGAGGIAVTNCDEIAAAIERRYRALRRPSAAAGARELAALIAMAIFIRPALYWIPAALPFLRLGETIFPHHVPLKRLSGLRAGMLRNWRRRLSESARARSAAAAYFAARLPVPLAAGPSYPYLRLPVLARTPEDKRRIEAISYARGLGLSRAYPTPIHEIPEVRRTVNGATFPAARRVADHLLTIPTHHWLSDRDKTAIADLWRDVPCA